MFSGAQPNPYEDIVLKTTDENLTSENWELILNLCDKVQEEGETGARNVIAAALKRLAHRNPNVQLYALALVEALSKNCGVEVHREIASRSFTQGLEKLISDRNTHDKVRRKALSLIAMWTGEFEKDPTLGVMEDCYNTLKAKNYKFEETIEAPPPQVEDEIRRKEEEELQRVLEMSVHDKGGRWDAYQAASSSGAGASGSSSSLPQSSAAAASSSSARPGYVPAASSSYAQAPAPARSPSPSAATPAVATSSHSASQSAQSTSAGFAQASPTAGPATVSRVRALHTFEPTEQGELAFDKGDIIKVVDRNYKDWWRGQLRGRTGIFPVNYVEPLPEPTAMEIAKEAEQEATIFAQAANIDKLLNMLRGLDPAKDNLADNDEIQELYRTSMSLRPKIVKLIDKYSQKRAELVMMNESFVKARTIFDRMMEESLSRHTGLYDARPPYQQPATQRVGARPGSQGGQPDYRNSSYIAYDQGGYGFPQPGQPGPAGYPAGGAPEPAYAGPPVASPYADPNAAAYAHQPPTYPQPQPFAGQPSVAARPSYSQHPQPTPDPSAYGSPVPGQAQPQAGAQAQYAGQSTAQPQPHAQQHAQPQAQSQALPQQNGHVEQTDQGQVPQQQPPYIFDPNATYADPNVQAWAQYYAQGGKDLAGAVYFISIPGVTDAQTPAPTATPAASQQGQPAQAQAQQQGAPVQGNAQYSAYNAQQQPANEPIPAYARPPSAGGSQPGPANTSPQMTHATAQPSSSPTRSNTIGASSYHQQPLSPSGAGPSQQQQQYPPNPYPVQGNGPQPSQSFEGSSHIPYDQQAQYNAQYGQMQGQFGNMGIGGEVAGSSSGIPAAAQTA